MRRFSQRNSLVTLSEINVTPLLDLAFVLLIIFIIVSGSIKVDYGIDMNLPDGGSPRTEVNPQDVRNVVVTKEGVYRLENRQVPIDVLERQLVTEVRANPNLVVYVRCDENGINKHSIGLLNRLALNNITRFQIVTEGPGQP